MYYVPYKCQVCLFLTFMHFFFNIAQHFFFFQTLGLYHLWKKISNKRLYYAFLSFFFKKKLLTFQSSNNNNNRNEKTKKEFFFKKKKTIFITVSFKSYYYYISFYQGLKLNITFRITIKNLKMSSMYLLPSSSES